MPRPRNPNPPVKLHIVVEPDLYAQAALQLYSPIEGRIPHGSWSDLHNTLLREYFVWGRLDLAPYGMPQGFFVRGPKEMLDALEARLRGESK